MNYFKLFLSVFCVLIFAQVGFAQEKICVVDIQEVVNNSSEVQALKREHSAQIESLNKIVTEAQNAIAAETDPKRIVMLQDRYTAEFNRKKETINRQYDAKLAVIEAKLRRNISESAKKNKYDVVLAKNMVFYGGEDITKIILKDIK